MYLVFFINQYMHNGPIAVDLKWMGMLEYKK